MLLVELLRQEFEELDGVGLMMACIEPTIRQVRGQHPSLKTERINKLNKAQQSLFMFRLLYPARNSEQDYQLWMNYVLQEPGYWSGINAGLRFFEEATMIEILQETEAALASSPPETLHTGISPLFEKFCAAFDDSLHRISQYIRTNPDKFIQFLN
ncbi:hypothetical protein P4H66_22525 [Paenibacillus dokdonensis]|uniref:Uncharacterized protein n=1 Tax=Paenibacillus dokdonensis TaxID=2567944 RepID=A0ABU6GT48_9BACL|nr:hypothetical protein [Paenibacillus dokdonensis]MEC0242593.1 hypothetical protein [Paenibacillus dokdonensis]